MNQGRHRAASPSAGHQGAGLSAFLSCRVRSGIHCCDVAEPKQTKRGVQDEWLVSLTSPCPCLSDGENCPDFYRDYHCGICQFILTQISESDLGKSISQVFHNAQCELLEKQVKAKKAPLRCSGLGSCQTRAAPSWMGLVLPLPVHQYRQGSAECSSGFTE